MKIRTLLLLALLSSPLAHADEAGRLKLAREVIEATRVDKMLDGMKGMLQQTAAAQLRESTSNFSKEKSADMEAMQKEIFDVTMNEAKEMIKSMDKIYADTFSEEELTGIRDFYQSKAGKAMIDKQPVIMQKMMPNIMGMQTSIKPKIEAIVKKYTGKMTQPETSAPSAK